MEELAAYADGTLDPRRRAELEREIAASPELQARLAEQQRALRAVRGVEAEPPQALRDQVESHRARSGRRTRRRRFVLSGAAASAVAAALLVVLATPLAGGPDLSEAAALGARAPEGSAPGVVSQSGLDFPDWAAKFGWQTSGVRRDELDGRDTTTVFYDKNGNRIGYTIVSGDKLDGVPDRGFRDYVDDGRRIVTWQRDGHTCVLSGPAAVQRDVLLKLAAADAAA